MCGGEWISYKLFFHFLWCQALSQTLFAVYINYRASTIKWIGCEVQSGGENISILLYADDINLMADSEDL